MTPPWPTPRQTDLVIAGAGIVGLALAAEGLRRGLRVMVVERDARASGASVRNFGHGCITAQTGQARAYALVARERWLSLRDEAGLWVREGGTVVAARSPQELAVLQEFVELNPEHAHLLTPAQVQGRVPVAAEGLLGGAFLPRDLQVDPRQAAPALAAYLQRSGVEFAFGTSALGAETGMLFTSRGEVRADAVVLAVGHDLDRLAPDLTSDAGMTRCSLHMLRVAAPSSQAFSSALLTGTSLLRYSGFLVCPSSAALAAQQTADHPELLAAGVNLMLTQQPNGDLLVGDTHAYGETPSPFAAEEVDALLLRQIERLLGSGPLTVLERWRGVYASAPGREYLVATPTPGVRAVAVTSGIGMSTALGLAPAVLADLLDNVAVSA